MIEISKITETEYRLNQKKIKLNKGFGGQIVSLSYDENITGREIMFFRKHLETTGVLTY